MRFTYLVALSYIAIQQCLAVSVEDLVQVNACVPFGNDFWVYRNGNLVMYRLGSSKVVVKDPVFQDKTSAITSDLENTPLGSHSTCFAKSAVEVPGTVQYSIRISAHAGTSETTRSFFMETSESDTSQASTGRNSAWKCSTVTDNDPSITLTVPPQWADPAFDDSSWKSAALVRRVRGTDNAVTTDYCAFAVTKAKRIWIAKPVPELGPDTSQSTIVCRATFENIDPIQVGRPSNPAQKQIYPTSSSPRHQPRLWFTFDQPIVSDFGPYSREWDLGHCAIGGIPQTNVEMESVRDQSGFETHGIAITSDTTGTTIIPAGIPDYVAPGVIGSGILDVAKHSSTYVSVSGVDALVSPFTLTFWLKPLPTTSTASRSFQHPVKFLAGNCPSNDVSNELAASTSEQDTIAKLDSMGCTFAVLSVWYPSNIVEGAPRLIVFLKSDTNEIKVAQSHRALVLNQWQHITVSLSSTKLWIHFDGMPDEMKYIGNEDSPFQLATVASNPFYIFAKRAISQPSMDHAAMIIDDLRILGTATHTVDLMHLTDVPITRLLSARLDVHRGQLLIKTDRPIRVESFHSKSAKLRILFDENQHQVEVVPGEVFRWSSDLDDPFSQTGFVVGIQIGEKQMIQIRKLAKHVVDEREQPGINQIILRSFETKFEWDDADTFCQHEASGMELCSWYQACNNATVLDGSLFENLEASAREGQPVVPSQGSWIPVSDGHGFWVDVTTCDAPTFLPSSTVLSTGLIACCSSDFQQVSRFKAERVFDLVGQELQVAANGANLEINMMEVSPENLIEPPQVTNVELNCETNLLGFAISQPAKVYHDSPNSASITISYTQPDGTTSSFVLFSTGETNHINEFIGENQGKDALPGDFLTLHIRNSELDLNTICRESIKIEISLDTGFLISQHTATGTSMTNAAVSKPVHVSLHLVRLEPTNAQDIGLQIATHGKLNLTAYFNQQLKPIQWDTDLEVSDYFTNNLVAILPAVATVLGNKLIVTTSSQTTLEHDRQYKFKIPDLLVQGELDIVQQFKELEQDVSEAPLIRYEDTCGQFGNLVFQHHSFNLKQNSFRNVKSKKIGKTVEVGTCAVKSHQFSKQHSDVFHTIHIGDDIDVLSSHLFSPAGASLESKFSVLQGPYFLLNPDTTLRFTARGFGLGTVTLIDPGLFECPRDETLFAIAVTVELFDPNTDTWYTSLQYNPISDLAWDQVEWNFGALNEMIINEVIQSRIDLKLDVLGRIRVYHWGPGWLELRDVHLENSCASCGAKNCHEQHMRRENMNVAKEQYVDLATNMLFRKSDHDDDDTTVYGGSQCEMQRGKLQSFAINIDNDTKGVSISFTAKLEFVAHATLSTFVLAELQPKPVGTWNSQLDNSTWTRVHVRVPVSPEDGSRITFNLQSVDLLDEPGCHIVHIKDVFISKTNGKFYRDTHSTCNYGSQLLPVWFSGTEGKVGHDGMAKTTVQIGSTTESTSFWPNSVELSMSGSQCIEYGTNMTSVCGFDAAIQLVQVPVIIIGNGERFNFHAIHVGEKVMQVAIAVQKSHDGNWEWINQPGSSVDLSLTVGSLPVLDVEYGFVQLRQSHFAYNVKVVIVSFQSDIPGESLLEVEVVPFVCHNDATAADVEGSESCRRSTKDYEDHERRSTGLVWSLHNKQSESDQQVSKSSVQSMMELETLQDVLGRCETCDTPDDNNHLGYPADVEHGILLSGFLGNQSQCNSTIGSWSQHAISTQDRVFSDAMEVLGQNKQGNEVVRFAIGVGFWNFTTSTNVVQEHISSDGNWDHVEKLVGYSVNGEARIVAITHEANENRLVILDGITLQVLLDITNQIIPLGHRFISPHHIYVQDNVLLLVWSTSPTLLQSIRLPTHSGDLIGDQDWDVLSFSFGKDHAWAVVPDSTMTKVFIGVDGGIVEEELNIPLPAPSREFRFAQYGLNEQQVVTSGTLFDAELCDSILGRRSDKTQVKCTSIPKRGFFGTSDGLLLEIDMDSFTLTRVVDVAQLREALGSGVRVTHMTHTVPKENQLIPAALVMVVSSQHAEELVVFSVGHTLDHGSITFVKAIQLPRKDVITGQVRSIQPIGRTKGDDDVHLGASGLSVLFDDGFVMVLDTCTLFADSVVDDVCHSAQYSLGNLWPQQCQTGLECRAGRCLPKTRLPDGALCETETITSRSTCVAGVCVPDQLKSHFQLCDGIPCPTALNYPGKQVGITVQHNINVSESHQPSMIVTTNNRVVKLNHELETETILELQGPDSRSLNAKQLELSEKYFENGYWDLNSDLEERDPVMGTEIAKHGVTLVDVDGDGSLDIFITLNAPHLHGPATFLVLLWDNDQRKYIRAETVNTPIPGNAYFVASVSALPKSPWGTNTNKPIEISIEGNVGRSKNWKVDSRVDHHDRIEKKVGSLGDSVSLSVPVWFSGSDTTASIDSFTFHAEAIVTLREPTKPVKLQSLIVGANVEVQGQGYLEAQCESNQHASEYRGLESVQSSIGTLDLYTIKATDFQNAQQWRVALNCSVGGESDPTSFDNDTNNTLVGVLGWDLTGNGQGDIIQVNSNSVQLWITSSLVTQASGQGDVRLRFQKGLMTEWDIEVSSFTMLALDVQQTPNLLVLFVNGSLEMVTLSGEEAPVNVTLPPVNATLPPVNATLPPVNATLPPVNATLPDTNSTLPDTNSTLPPVNPAMPFNNSDSKSLQSHAAQLSSPVILKQGKIVSFHANADPLPDFVVAGLESEVTVGAQIGIWNESNNHFDVHSIWTLDVSTMEAITKASVQGLQIGDVDNDGDMDIVVLVEKHYVTEDNAFQVVVLENTPVAFAAHYPSLSQCESGVRNFQLLGLNKDKWLDVVCVTENGISVAEGPLISADVPHRTGMTKSNYASYAETLLSV